MNYLTIGLSFVESIVNNAVNKVNATVVKVAMKLLLSPSQMTF